LSLVTYDGLCQLVDRGFITGVDPSAIGPASIDIHLGETLLIEDPERGKRIRLDDRKDSLPLIRAPVDAEGYWELPPGAFALSSTVERFNLPAYIACELKLRSNIARRALGHLLAGWADPGFNDADLTLEIKNESQYSTLMLKPGLSIGQLVFWHGPPVPKRKSYAVRGTFNGQSGPTSVLP
jgi:dCTP deaminase